MVDPGTRLTTLTLLDSGILEHCLSIFRTDLTEILQVLFHHNRLSVLWKTLETFNTLKYVSNVILGRLEH